MPRPSTINPCESRRQLHILRQLLRRPARSATWISELAHQARVLRDAAFLQRPNSVQCVRDVFRAIGFGTREMLQARIHGESSPAMPIDDADLVLVDTSDILRCDVSWRNCRPCGLHISSRKRRARARGQGVCAWSCLAERTQCVLQERASVSYHRTTPPPHTYTCNYIGTSQSIRLGK